jgi:hypothetical protein
MGGAAFGVLGGALVAGVMTGTLMAATLAPRRTASALGVAMLFCALSVGLLASATLASTAVAATIVLGISAGVTGWLLRTDAQHGAPPVGVGTFAAAAIGGVALATVDASGALWIVGAPLAVLGVLALVSGVPTRVAEAEVAFS